MSVSELLELDAPAAPAGTERDRTRRQVLDAIRGLHGTHGGLSRVHHTHPALYAQARRAFGTWRAAVAAAGIDYQHERSTSLKRGLSMRDQRRAVWHALSRFLIDHPGADQGLLDSIRPELARRVHRCWGDLGAARTWAAGRGSRATA